MPIREFEMMHGTVLTKLCRNDQPIALSLIETRNEQRAVYWVNDEIILYINTVWLDEIDGAACPGGSPLPPTIST